MDGACTQCDVTRNDQIAQTDAMDIALADMVSNDGVAPDGGCTAATCAAPGSACVDGACTMDCRRTGAIACSAGTMCDFTDGLCRAPGACVLAAHFDACATGSAMCGPGTECDAGGNCAIAGGCTGLVCEPDGRCFADRCPCMRPAPTCSVAPLTSLNRPEFAGAQPINTNQGEGIMDLEFDDICSAYAVTVISGTDQLRQVTPDGTLTAWNSVSNLDMGEVAVLRLPGNRPGTTLGEVAATYICIAGCTPTGEDGQMGVVRLDRTSTSRPLPNVVPAAQTIGTGPFRNTVVDAGPYGLTWGRDRTLYIGNLDANGNFFRVDLITRTPTMVAHFTARVTASTVYDATHLLVAIEGSEVYMLATATGAIALWAILGPHVTSIARDGFTGRIYAEISATPPRIVEITADGTGVTTFQNPARLGRIAIAPDGYLYHASVYPNVQWSDTTAPPIERWALPVTR